MTVTANISKTAHCSSRVLLGSFFITVMGGLLSCENTQHAAKFVSVSPFLKDESCDANGEGA